MATVRMPSSLHAQITRRAISPRLAMRILRNMRPGLTPRPDGEELLAVFHRLAVVDEALHDLARNVALDLVHELHGFDDAQHLAVLHRVTRLDEGRRAGRAGFVKGADDRRGDQVKSGFL